MTPLRTPQADRILSMTKRLADQFKPDRIILFGSHSRGDAGPDSDVDLLVVMPLAGSRREIGRDMTLAVAGFGLPNDILVVTPEEVERDRDQVGTVIRPALREGIVLHERST
ncbi:MAG: nucleotidyltransferase domain-containing protein [bacterium]